MTLVLQSDHSKPWLWQFRLLPVAWFLGLASGIAFFFKAAPNFLSLMRGNSSVSIVGFLVSALFPFLISAFAVIFSKPWLILAVSFFKAFSFCLISASILLDFGDGSWLMQQLLMFHEIYCIPVLYTFWRRSLRFRSIPSAAECLFWVSLVILIVGMDYRLVSPFAAGLTIL